MVVGEVGGGVGGFNGLEQEVARAANDNDLEMEDSRRKAVAEDEAIVTMKEATEVIFLLYFRMMSMSCDYFNGCFCWMT